MAVTLSLFAGAGQQFFDDNGNVLSGGKIYTYFAGTTTPATTYTSSTGAVAHANPIILNAAGRISPGGEIWLTVGIGYKFVVKTATDILVATYDNIPSSMQPPITNDASSVAYEQGYVASAGQFIIGATYRIVSIGTTDFTLIGASSNTVGSYFTATGAGTGTGTAKISQTVQYKLQQIVSVKDFGAVGDGVTDDTAAVHASFNYAIANTSAVFFPAGTYRVTSGYDHTTLTDLRIFGVSSSQGYTPRTTIKLDSTNPASYFMKIGGNYPSFAAADISFQCAQSVTDRRFFIYNGFNLTPTFTNVTFFNVEKPINFIEGCYCQSANITNVIFRSSGTIHSQVGGTGETNSLRCTLMELNNVYVEDIHPTTNTHKVVMDLTGIRSIVAINLLIECAIPDNTWIPLVISNPYDSGFRQYPTAMLNSLHIETPVTGGGAPVLSVQIKDGYTQINNLMTLSGGKIYVNTRSTVDITGASFATSYNPLTSYFSLQDQYSRVILNDCLYRVAGDALTNTSYTLNNCVFVRDGAAISLLSASTSISNTLPTVLYQWDGGYVDTGKAILSSSPSTYTISTDAAYGRKIVFSSNSSFNFSAKTANLKKGTQVTPVALIKLPTFTGGTFEILWLENTSVIGGAEVYDAAYSGKIISVVVPFALTADGLTSCGFRLGNAASGVSGNIELYGYTQYIGNAVPKYPFYNYPANIQTYASAVPTTGTWARGDIVINSSPTTGQPRGWTCTVAGTPGTWVSQGNL